MEEKQTGLLEAFAAWLRENEKSAATVEKYVREAAAFISFLSGETEVTEHGITSAADGRESVPVADVHGIVTASDERERVSVADGCGIVPAAEGCGIVPAANGRESAPAANECASVSATEKEIAPVAKEKMLAPATKDRLIGTVTKERVIAYKELLASRWCARSVNGKLAAVNALLVFLGLPECRVKALKFQRQTFCPPERELTRAEFGRLLRAAEHDPVTGKQIFKNVLGKSQAEVKEKLTAAIQQTAGLDILKAEQYTVETWLQFWLDNFGKMTMRPSTFESYSGNLRIHIKPHIGGIKLTKLRTSDLQKFYSKLLTEGRIVRKESEKQPKGLSPKTVRNVHIFISTALGPKNAAAGGR